MVQYQTPENPLKHISMQSNITSEETALIDTASAIGNSVHKSSHAMRDPLLFAHLRSASTRFSEVSDDVQHYSALNDRISRGEQAL